MPAAHLAIDVFISHSSRDVHLAATLIDLFRAAMDIPHEAIRCTSVDGYRLPGGASNEEQLKLEVRESKFFIALITPASLHSPYVLFELGARWGAQLRLVPFLAKGCSVSDLKAPLSSLNALHCSSRAQVHQLLAEIADSLGVRLHPPATYERALVRLLEVDAMLAPDYVPAADEPVEVQAEPTVHAVPTTEGGKALLELIQQEGEIDERGLVQIRDELRPGQANFFPKIQYAGTALGMKSRLFREAINELVAHKWLLPPQENESTNTRTFEWSGPNE